MRDTKTIRLFIIFFTISFSLLFLGQTGMIDPVRGKAMETVSRSQQETYSFWQKILNEFKVFTFWRNGQNKLRNFEERNRELLVKASRVDSLEKENKILREQLGVDLDPEWKYIMARVISFREGFKIDKGVKDGVRKDMVVILDNVLIGRVVKTYDRIAEIEVPFDSRSKIEAVTLKNGSRGILKGVFDRSLLLISVLQEEQLIIGEEVVTSGESGFFPEGLILGKIKKINKKESALFQEAEVEPALDFAEVEEVFIIKD